MDATITKVDAIAESAVVELINILFKDIAYLDYETVYHNVKRACDMDKSDRSIRAERANYLLNHFEMFYIGLIANAEFRESFKDAVSVEIALDDEPEDSVREIRMSMHDAKKPESRGNFIIDLSKYNDGVYKKISGMISDSFGKVKAYESVVDELSAELSDDAKIEIGFCMSNFMYLIRAFSKNDMFFNYVRSIIRSVQKELSIN